VHRILARAKTDIDALIGNTQKIKSLRPQDFVDAQFGLPTVSDILAELEKPGRDPRPAFRTATFAEGVHKIADLEPGMLLEGVVTNVAAFGAFVDVGVHQDGLVHVSAMSNQFVSDPRDVVKSGDVVRVKVLEVDEARKRISLTLRLEDEAGAGARPGRDQNRDQNRERKGGPRGPRGGDHGRGDQGRGDQGRGDQGRGDQRGRGGDRRGGDQRRGGERKGGGQRQGSAAPSNSAMADALRRAGLAGGDGKR
jgi:uncharacterized protein